MTKNPTRYFIAHSPEGRILAAAPVEAVTTEKGVQLRLRPLPGPNHVISEIDIADEQVIVMKNSGLHEFEVDSRGGVPQLRHRSRA
jgi:hypothetical protein